MRAAEGRVLIDTNILIYATLEDDPRFAQARRLLLSPGDGERFVSVQNLAEMYPNLTGPKMEHPDPPSVARAKITSIASLPTLQVLPLTGDVQSIALELCEKYGITREMQDQIGYDSQRKAAAAIANGKFKAEIVPVVIPQRKGDPKVFDTDEIPLRPPRTSLPIQRSTRQ